MYPVLFTIPLFGGIPIYSYGVMVALGFIAGMAWVGYESRRLKQDPGRAMDLVFYVIVAAIVGSRILHVLISERDRFFANPLMIFKIWEGGLVFYGGLLGALLVSAWYIRRHHMQLWVTVDIFAPAIALGHAIGRVGCLLAGCCFGRVADMAHWYTLIFPGDVHSFAPSGIPLFPTQPMETIGEFIIFGILFGLRRVKRFEGQILASYLILYAILRTITEQFRGDVERGFLIEPWLSTSRFISLFLFVAGITIYVMRWSKGCAENRREAA